MKNSIYVIAAFLFLSSCAQQSSDATSSDTDTTSVEQEENSVEETGVFFENISELDTLESPFVLEMGVKGMLVEPKGPVVEGSGHHHLLINDGPFEKGKFIAPDSTHIHYGGAETADTVSLAPGKYLLTLQFGDGAHMSYGQEWAKSITVYVK